MIEILPIEVLRIVLSNLPVVDLKAVRLLSRSLTQAPLEHIFKRLRIVIHPQSMLIVAAIIRD